jgi:hypothetical protein
VLVLRAKVQLAAMAGYTCGAHAGSLWLALAAACLALRAQWVLQFVCAPVLSSVQHSHSSDLASPPLPQVAGELVSRFREREEGVKADVFATYGVLLEQVREGGRRYAPQDPNR